MFYEKTTIDHPNDAYWLGLTQMFAGQYARANTILEPFMTDALCRYLLAKVWLKMDRLGDALELVGVEDGWPHEPVPNHVSTVKVNPNHIIVKKSLTCILNGVSLFFFFQ